MVAEIGLSGSLLNLIVGERWPTKRGGAGALVYVTAKGGINSVTRALTKELAPRDMRVNAFSPGMIDTRTIKSFLILNGSRT